MTLPRTIRTLVTTFALGAALAACGGPVSDGTNPEPQVSEGQSVQAAVSLPERPIIRVFGRWNGEGVAAFCEAHERFVVVDDFTTFRCFPKFIAGTGGPPCACTATPASDRR